jgi:hypothetical protein
MGLEAPCSHPRGNSKLDDNGKCNGGFFGSLKIAVFHKRWREQATTSAREEDFYIPTHRVKQRRDEWGTRTVVE